MRRLQLGLGAAAVFLALAWVWPSGSPPDATGQEGQAAPPTTAPAETTEPEPSEPEPSEPVPVEPVEDLPPADDGPLGTRNHTGTDDLSLTFDDGPDPQWTPQVLQMLRERDIQATFCVIGAYAEANPELIAEMVEDGHTLCNHAWYHEIDLGDRSAKEIEANLQRTNDAIEQAAPGAEVEYYRQPGGQWTDRVVAVAADMGMESLHWTVDPSDWDKSTAEKEIRDHVLDKSESGSIVLLHDGGANQKDMLAAIEDVLDEFEQRGWSIRPL